MLCQTCVQHVFRTLAASSCINCDSASNPIRVASSMLQCDWSQLVNRLCQDFAPDERPRARPALAPEMPPSPPISLPLRSPQAAGEAAGDLFGRLRAAVAQRKAAERSQRSDYFPVQLNTQGMMVGRLGRESGGVSGQRL